MDDTISRRLAIDALKRAEALARAFGYHIVIETVMELPSAQPEQPPEIQDILNYLDTVLHPIISPEHWDAYSALHDMISSLPSAEPEIVRCKNCKYWRAHKYEKETKRYIPFCGFNAIYTKADDFCSKGTRRTE